MENEKIYNLICSGESSLHTTLEEASARGIAYDEDFYIYVFEKVNGKYECVKSYSFDDFESEE